MKEMTFTALKKLKRPRNLVLACIYFLFALSGIRGALFADPQPADLLVSLAISAAMVKFCSVDSKCRGKPLLNSFYWIIFFTWPVSVPLYWFWTRGIRGIVWAVLFVISLAVVSFTFFWVTVYFA
jgi:hypothetical protein